MNFQASHKTAMILSERGYAVKERGVIKVRAFIVFFIIFILSVPCNPPTHQVKGKGLMRTYFVLGRKISRGRYGKGGSGAAGAAGSLAEVRTCLFGILALVT